MCCAAACAIVVGGCPGNCTGHGTCFNGTCHCDVGFVRDDCSVVAQTCDKNCSGHGRCVDAVCECHGGFDGSACDVVLGNQCPRNCTGHGTCDELSGSCVCDSGYGGRDCGSAAASCPRSKSGEQCSTRGNCENGECACLSGYSGRDCSITCPSRCTSATNGVCIDGACQCKHGWTGEACADAVKLVQMTSLLMDQPVDGSLTVFRPLSIMIIGVMVILLVTCALGYLLNLLQGFRGTAAIPFYRYLSASMSYSDYQLKPNPNPHGM